MSLMVYRHGVFAPAAPVPTYSFEGVWSWFSDPRALSVAGTPAVGCVKEDGSIVVYPVTGTPTATNLKATYAVDDHNVPGFLRRDSDGRILAFYTGHVDASFYMRVSTNVDDVTAWGAETNLDSQFGLDLYTYANPVQLTGETNDPIYLFFRAQPSGLGADRSFHYSKSTDGGSTWGTPTRLINGSHHYIRIIRTSTTRIDVCFAKHPDPNQSIPSPASDGDLYHIYYEGGTWQEIGGVSALTLPITPTTDLTPVWDGSTAAGRAWATDIAVDGSGNPVIGYTVYPTPTNPRNRYARHNGTSWVDNEVIGGGGRLISENQIQPYYTGGLGLDHSNPNVIYVSQKFGSTWVILRGRTTDNGATWAFTKVAEQVGGKAFRPIIIREQVTEPRLAYLDGTYTDGMVYNTDVKVISSAAGTNAGPSAVTLDRTFVKHARTTGTVVGTLGATRSDFDDVHTFSIVTDTDSKFQISGSQLQLSASVDTGVSTSHSVTIRATDSQGQTADTAFTIRVLDVIPPQVITAPLRDTTGNQDITIPGFGTPSGAWVICSNALEKDLTRDSLVASLGGTDGTRQFVSAVASRDAAATSETDRRGATDEVLMVLDPGGTVIAEASATLITDGIRLNIGATGTGAYQVAVVLFDADWGVYANTLTLATQNNTATLTPGFQSDFVLTASHTGAYSDAALNTPAMLTTGFGSYAGATIRQACLSYRSDDAATTGTRGDVRNNAVWSLQASNRYAEITTVNTTQIIFTSRNGDLSTFSMGCLAVNAPSGVEAWVGVIDSPTTTGPKNMTGPTFTPSFCMMLPNMVDTVNTEKLDGQASAWGVAAFEADTEVCVSFADEDNSADSDTQSHFSSKAINLYDHAGTLAHAATRTAFISTGVTLEFITANGTARKWPVLFTK